MNDNQIKKTNFMDELVNDAMCELQKLTIRPIKHLKIVDQSVDYEIEWCVWKQPYQRILSGFIEL